MLSQTILENMATWVLCVCNHELVSEAQVQNVLLFVIHVL